jgi:hypothetical protein
VRVAHTIGLDLRPQYRLKVIPDGLYVDMPPFTSLGKAQQAADRLNEQEDAPPTVDRAS